MLSKNKVKFINSLNLKKFRDETNMFIAEGTKLINDLSVTFHCELLVVTSEWLENNTPIRTKELLEVNFEEFKKISNQKNPQGILAVFGKATDTALSLEEIGSELSLALDKIQDPGNMGTIIRIADWFGIKHIFASQTSADAFAPKVVQASMGALARVQVQEVDLENFLLTLKEKLPIYGTFLKGENIYTTPLSSNGIIVLGNEGNGISPAIEKLITERLFIPNYPPGNFTSESLNVSVAAALVCAEFRRRLK
jgi:TrmH family RNA methyltransferase